MTTENAINVEIDGQFFQAEEGMTILQVAKREGIDIPTLCNHDALEPAGACRMCVVEITHADWKGWKGLVTSCLYPVEEGLQVTTDNEELRATRKTLMDLLLARCPESTFIQKRAAEYGITATSFKKNEVDTVCILCGLCVRVCAAKGCDAIGTADRGVGKTISMPFDQPPPDCIGCASCAHICPTDAIEYEDAGNVRKIWGHTFEMVGCKSCGMPIMPEKQLAFEAEKSGLDPDYFATCARCAQNKTVETIKSSFDMKSVALAELSGAER